MTGPTSDRKQRGAWFTPHHLVEQVVAAVVDESLVASRAGRALRVLDPACGDGRFLTAALDAIARCGGTASALGIDIDIDAASHVRMHTDADAICADALDPAWRFEHTQTFDLVIGNPPFLSQMASATSRGGSSRHGGGPYADAAAEFLALASDLVDPDGGRIAFVVPQSILTARDSGAVRESIDRRATMFWSSWTGERDFDAQVVTCAVAFEFDISPSRARAEPTAEGWSRVVTGRAGVPDLPSAMLTATSGTLGDRARLNANFRDEYYGMIGAVGDHEDGPPLITSGLIDPGRSLWGHRQVRFAKQRFDRPRIDLAALDPKMRSWADRRLVPKVLIANQTSILEAVCDPDGSWLPGVPVVAAYPDDVETAWRIGAVLTSPAASVWAWHRRGGSGLSASTIRVGPTMLAELPWPDGLLEDAVAALQAGDIVGCGRAVHVAYGIDRESDLRSTDWWRRILERIIHRR